MKMDATVDVTNIKVKTTKNSNIRQFSLDRKTLKKIIRSKSKASKTKCKIFSEIGNELVCKILEINGVKGIYVEHKCLQIVKEKDNVWAKLESNICEEISHCFKKTT